MDSSLPAGTVTFLFTDIAGSTRLLQHLGGDVYGKLLAEQRAILRTAFEAHAGREVDTQGDSFFASFPRASDALNAVVQILRALADHEWPGGVEVRVRMGLHTGEPWLVEEGYVGMDVHRAARIGNAGHGGQVLLSETTTSLVRGELPEGLSLLDLGRHRLKDVRRAEPIHQLVIGGLPREFPALKSEEALPPYARAADEMDGVREPRQVGPSPYRGLAAFREADAEFFFGRETFTEQLYDTVTRQPMTAVIVGSSGAGKSSAVAAGLLPRLRSEGGWQIVQIRPGPEPFRALAGALERMLDPGLAEAARLVETSRLAEAIRGGEIGLFHTVERLLEQAATVRRLLLVIDQFEELYTLCDDPEIRGAFLDELLAAVRTAAAQRPAPFVLLLTLRADFMGQALTHRPFADVLQGGSLLLGPMNRAELQAAIEKPAEKQGASFETGLVARILDDVGEEPGNLPLLEFALTLLWDKMDGGWLTHAAYEAIGRVDGALSRHAEEVYAGLGEPDQAEARRVFIQLVQPGDGTEDTRRVAGRAEVGAENWNLVQHLADRRLVVTGLDQAGRETVEVVHEALIRSWARLRAWMAEDRAFRTWQEGLRAALRSWEHSGGDDGALLRGGPLAQAEDWLAERGDYIGETEKNFIQASADLRSRRQVERERRRRLIVSGLALGFVVAVLLSVFAFSQRGVAQSEALFRATQQAVAESERIRAEEEADARATQQAVAEAEVQARGTQQAIAEEQASARATQQAIAEAAARISLSRQLAASAVNSLDVDPERGILLALQALSTANTREAEEALHQAVQSSSLRQTIYTGIEQELGMYWFTSSPNGEQVFVSGAGGGSMWDINSGTMIFSLSVPDDDWINHAAFSPNGSMLAIPRETYDEEGNNLPGVVTILDAKSGQEILNFTAHDVWVQGLAFSQDGAYLATISGDRNPKVWDFEATLAEGVGQLVWTLCCPEDWDNFVEFSPDGTNLVTTTGGGEAIVWDMATGEQKLLISPSVDLITYSPDGNYLVSVSHLGLTQVWDATTGEQLFSTVISDRSAFADSIKFSPDGSLVAIGKRSGRVTLLNFSPNEIFESRVIPGHSEAVTGVEFSPDSQMLYSSSLDGTIRIWDISPSGNSEFAAIPSSALINDIEVLHNSQLMVSVGPDGYLRVWDMDTWQENLNLQLAGGLHRIARSPDGKQVATGGSEGLVTVVDTETWEEVLSFQAHPPTGGPFYFGMIDLAFSPDGQRLVTGSAEGAVSIWDSSTGDQILTLADNLGQVNRVSYSPDGRLVAAGALETAHIWDANTGQLLTTFAPDDWQSEDRFHWAIDFSPDSARLALGRSDSVFEVWELPTGLWEPGDQIPQLLYKGQSQSGFINSIIFSPNGESITLSGWSDVLERRKADNGDLSLNLNIPGGIYELVLSPDGKQLFIVGFDRSLQVIAPELDELIALAKTRVTRSLTTEECQTYLHLDECPSN